jgi:septal ring factor EnvC (AmiA/AmiB activator)
MTGTFYKYFVILLIVLIASGKLFSQEEEIKAKQGQLSSIKDEITSLETELKSKTRKEKESFSAIENYSRQSFLINKLIGSYRTEEKQKEAKISESEQKISQLEDEIKQLQKNYAKYIKAAYMHGQPDELEMVVDAASVQQALLRLKYLEKFSDQRTKDIAKLKESREQLIVEKEILKKEKEAKAQLAAAKEKEESTLLSRLDERKRILKIIKHDKSELKKEIEAKKQAEIKIRSLITNLIAEAERKKKEEADRLAREKLKGDVRPAEDLSDIKAENNIGESSAYDVNLSTSDFASFSSLKGRLNWPVANGKIIRKYGENRNNKTNTVMLNYGVDIAASKDINVKAVSDGVISAIDWIPGYGSVVIVTHKGDYRTVYSHLSEIYVNEGDKVKPGSVIAQVGDSIEGKILHFEIWNSRENQNPEVWLARK